MAKGDEIPGTVRMLPVAAEIMGMSVSRLRTWVRKGKLTVYRSAAHGGKRLYMVDLAELIDRLERVEPTKFAERRRAIAAAARAAKYQKEAERRMGGVQPGAMPATPPDRS